VVTVNSATLVNKGLELIETHLLFDIPYDRIDVVIHPQSVIHSMVTFTDGSTIAQASPPDMRLPIALALGWPDRVAGAAPACAFTSPVSWTFEPVDTETFPAIELAKSAGAAGGCVPAVFNAANEEAVAAFLDGHCSFLGIIETVAAVLDEASGWRADPTTVEDVLAAEDWARSRATELLAGRVARTGRSPR
jgi:1-deoxy-D-xylulose-5-phosphate reductoisomerase